MDAQAIKTVTAAFRDRLLAVFSVNKIAGPVFVGPLDDPNAAGAAAVLFLYRVAVNAELRNAEHQRAPLPPGTTPTLLSGGLPLDLYYLLTAGTAQTGGEIDALGTLGFAMQNINDLPNLVGSPVANETVRLTLDSVTSEEMGRIWTLFPTANYRTAVIYLASPVWIDPAQSPLAGSPVLREPHRIGPLAA